MLGALVQAIVVKLYRLRIRNQGFRLYRRAHRREQVARRATALTASSSISVAAPKFRCMILPSNS